MQHVTVIMPVHCPHQYLDEAVNSILSQTYKSFTLVIVVNGSDEQFKNFLVNKYSGDIRVRVLTTNICYIPFSLNYAVHSSQSDILIRMDSDDVSYPDRISSIVHAFNNSDADVVFSNYSFIDENGTVIRKTTNLPTDDLIIKRKMMYRCVIPHPTVAFKKDIFQSVGGYSFGRYSEDYDLWLRLIREKRVKFFCINSPQLAYRIHRSQITSKSNLYTIFCFDLCLKIRELFLSRRLIWLLPILLLPFDYIYQRYFVSIINAALAKIHKR